MALARARIADDPGGSVNCAWPSRTFSVALRPVSSASRYLTWMDLAFEVATRVTSPDPDADDVTDSVAVGFGVEAGACVVVVGLGPVAAAVGDPAGEAPELVASAGRPASSRATVSAIAATIRFERTRTSPMPQRKGSFLTSCRGSYCTRGVLAGPCPVLGVGAFVEVPVGGVRRGGLTSAPSGGDRVETEAAVVRDPSIVEVQTQALGVDINGTLQGRM